MTFVLVKDIQPDFRICDICSCIRTTRPMNKVALRIVPPLCFVIQGCKWVTIGVFGFLILIYFLFQINYVVFILSNFGST